MTDFNHKKWAEAPAPDWINLEDDPDQKPDSDDEDESEETDDL